MRMDMLIFIIFKNNMFILFKLVTMLSQEVEIEFHFLLTLLNTQSNQSAFF